MRTGTGHPGTPCQNLGCYHAGSGRLNRSVLWPVQAGLACNRIVQHRIWAAQAAFTSPNLTLLTGFQMSLRNPGRERSRITNIGWLDEARRLFAMSLSRWRSKAAWCCEDSVTMGCAAAALPSLWCARAHDFSAIE